jgi:hypothetical protein
MRWPRHSIRPLPRRVPWGGGRVQRVGPPVSPVSPRRWRAGCGQSGQDPVSTSPVPGQQGPARCWPKQEYSARKRAMAAMASKSKT